MHRTFNSLEEVKDNIVDIDDLLEYYESDPDSLHYNESTGSSLKSQAENLSDDRPELEYRCIFFFILMAEHNIGFSCIRFNPSKIDYVKSKIYEKL